MADNDLSEAFETVSAQINENELAAELVGDLDLREVLVNINTLVSSELSGIDGLSDDDPTQNEEVMRNIFESGCTKAFFAGLAVGAERGGFVQPGGVVVQVTAEALQNIGLTAIKDGALSFTLVAIDE